MLVFEDTCRRRRVDLWLARKTSELIARIWPSMCRGACLPLCALCSTLWFAMVCGRCATRYALGAREYGIWCAVAEEWYVGACACLVVLPLSLASTIRCAVKIGYYALADIMAPDALEVLVGALRPACAVSLWRLVAVALRTQPVVPFRDAGAVIAVALVMRDWHVRCGCRALSAAAVALALSDTTDFACCGALALLACC